MSLTAVCVAVIAAGAGTPRLAGALDQAPQQPEPAAIDAGHFTDGHTNADGHHAEVDCAQPSGENAEGKYIPCTHGADPAPRGFSIEREIPALDPTANVNALMAAPSVVCDGDGVSGKRVEVLYVHGSSNRYDEYLSQLVQWSVGMDEIYRASAAETGGERRLRFVTEGTGTCTPVIRKVAVADSALKDFGSSIDAIRAQGYNRTDRKYVMFTDTNVYCGIGEFAGDTRKSDSNRSNGGPSYGRVDNGCWDAATAAHELGHNLGAVNNNAPNSSKGAHCVDEWDVMCYSDTPNKPAMKILCTDRAHNERLDCNHDDYYSTAPAAGSYLANNFNVADNLYLIKGAVTPPPPPPTPTDYNLVHSASGKCLDLRFGRVDNGNVLHLWDCHKDDLPHYNQRFSQQTDGTIRVNGKCLDVYGHGTANESKVVLWDCHGAPNQEWVLQTDGRIVGVESGKCLTTAKAATANGSRTVISTCNGSAAQKWTQQA